MKIRLLALLGLIGLVKTAWGLNYDDKVQRFPGKSG
jgi:hypothetical protein